MKKCNDILREYSDTLNLFKPELTPHRYHNILQTDKNGLVLHEIFGIHQDEPYYIKLFVITDNKGNYDHDNGIHIVVSSRDFDDRFDIYKVDEITEFKKRNGWEYDYSALSV